MDRFLEGDVIKDENGIEIEFYQTQAFSATIKPEQLEVERKMKKIFV